MGRMRALLAGEDGPGRNALPCGEFLSPVPLAALLLLTLNDWWWKHSPNALTGKLSDVAGLLFFPLLATAAVDCLLYLAFRLGAPVDFTLRRSKLLVACLMTAGVFSAIKLFPSARDAVVAIGQAFGLATRITLDPTDLLALPSIGVAWILGCREIRRMPLGRLAYALRTPRPAREHLRDLAACGAELVAVDALATAIDEYRHRPGDASRKALCTALRAVRYNSPKVS